ncbi:zinc finger MYM-type protein 1-like protein [Tanacetum coccineum]
MAYDVSRIRKPDDDLSRVRSAYDANVNMFSLMIHHGGVFVGFPERRYVNGQEAYIDLIDIDTFSVLELSSFMKELGYTHGRPMFYHFRVPNNDLDYGLKALACDEDVITLSKHVGEHKLINVYIEHDLTRLNINFTSPPVAELDNDFDPFLGLDDIIGNQNLGKVMDDCVTRKTDKGKEKMVDDCVTTKANKGNKRVVDDGENSNDSDDSQDGCSSHSAINNEAKDVDKHVEVIDNDSFDSSKSDEVKKHSLETRRELKLVKNDKERVRAICFGTILVFSDGPNDGGPSNIGCSSIVPINIRVLILETTFVGVESRVLIPEMTFVGVESRMIEEEELSTQTYNGEEKKERKREELGDFNILSSLSIRKTPVQTAGEYQVEVNPEIPVKAIQDQLQKKYRLDVSKMKAFRAKSKAYAHVRGDYREQYKVLRNYCLELSHKNPRTTTAGIRDLFGLDEAFMKGPFSGQVHAVVGLDSNNGIYPVAYAIVEAENKDSWTWFLECLGDDLNLEHYSSETLFTFINCPSREGMEGKSFEEGLAEITQTLKRLQSTLSIKAAIKEEVDHEEQFDFLGVQLNQRIPNRTVKARKVKAMLFWRKFIVTIDRTRRPKSIQSVVMLRLGHHHPSVARGNIRVLGLNVQRARQDFSLARRDISLVTKKLHISIKASIKEEVDHEEQFDFLGVQLNQQIPNRTVKARKAKARLFWRKFTVTIDRTRRPKSIQSVVMLRLGHHHPSVAGVKIRFLGLNVQREIKDNIWELESRGLKSSNEHLRTSVFAGAAVVIDSFPRL